MQSTGFAFGLMPVLKKLYKGERLKQAIARHLEYFNTNPYMAGFIFGVCAKMEHMASVSDKTQLKAVLEKIKTLKSAMSASMAAIGDRLFWGLLKPLCFLITLPIALLAVKPQEQTINRCIIMVAVIAGFATYNAFTLFIRWKSIEYGYKCAQNKYCGADFLNWNETIRTLTKIGKFAMLVLLAVSGVMIYKIIRYPIIAENQSFYIPLAVIVFVISFLFGRKYSTIAISFFAFVVFIVGFGFFAILH